MTTTKPLLVGESNPYGADPAFALYPYPQGCAGHRLCFRILGMSRAAYMKEFDRVNLCAGRWSEPAARAAADAHRAGHARAFILCGSKVTRAFGFPFEPLKAIVAGPWRYLILNHPSGLCRAWGKPGAEERARDAVRAFLPEISWADAGARD